MNWVEYYKVNSIINEYLVKNGWPKRPSNSPSFVFEMVNSNKDTIRAWYMGTIDDYHMAVFNSNSWETEKVNIAIIGEFTTYITGKDSKDRGVTITTFPNHESDSGMKLFIDNFHTYMLEKHILDNPF